MINGEKQRAIRHLPRYKSHITTFPFSKPIAIWEVQDEIAEAVTLQEKGHTTSGLCSKSVRSEENCVAIPYLQCTFSSVHEIKKVILWRGIGSPSGYSNCIQYHRCALADSNPCGASYFQQFNGCLIPKWDLEGKISKESCALFSHTHTKTTKNTLALRKVGSLKPLPIDQNLKDYHTC